MGLRNIIKVAPKGFQLRLAVKVVGRAQLRLCLSEIKVASAEIQLRLCGAFAIKVVGLSILMGL